MLLPGGKGPRPPALRASGESNGGWQLSEPASRRVPIATSRPPAGTHAKRRRFSRAPAPPSSISSSNARTAALLRSVGNSSCPLFFYQFLPQIKQHSPLQSELHNQQIQAGRQLPVAPSLQ
ncbi:hypothetical protein GQ55_5G394900 [Panicum hallii var. hallii]|uniref:Uncharacterized protein n=1 Tax=Panicum hallii var. hallii TaxID=1504633 RepID=A0A2T7DN70_9POAL|nr:hypothetical protein GQ55_5G394900 [Panicum hallii var. hallii]